MSIIAKLKEKLCEDKTFVRFLIVGVINTMVGSAIMFTCYNFLGLDYWISSVTNLTLTSILSYFLNKNYTFKNKEKGKKVIFKFIANIAICYFVAYGIAKQAVNLVLVNVDTKIKGNIALFVGMGVFTITNYIGQKLIVFRKKRINDNISGRGR